MRRIVFLCAAVIAAAPLLCRADDLADKHRAFAGWSSADNLAWHATGTRGPGGNALSLTETQRGILFRDATSNSRGVPGAIGFNGRLVWSTDENGFLAVQLGREAQAQIALDIVRSESVGDLKSVVAGHTSYAGAPVSIVQIQPAGLPPIDIYEDDRTGAYVRVVVAPGGTDERTFDDLQYTQIGARRFLSSWRSSDGEYHLTQFDFSKPVSDTELQPPSPQAQWTYGTAAVPFDLATITDNARIVRVRASVNGQSGIFVLSTGAPGIILYSDFANLAGVEDAGTVPYSPFSGNVTFAGLGRVRELRLGDSTLRNVIVTRLTAPDNRLAGILGYDFFANAVVDADLVKQQLTINAPQTAATPGPGGYAFPIDLTSRTPVIALPVQGGVAHPALDTSLTSFIIASQTLRDTGRISGQDISSQAAVGFGGQGATADPIATVGLGLTYTDWHSTSTTGSCVTTQQMDIGPYRYENPPVCFEGSSVFGADGGLIGLDFLRHFNWTIDYPHQRFVVTPNGQ